MARLPKNINQFGSKDLPSSLQLLSRALAIAFFLLLGSSNLNAQVNLLYYISDGDNTLYTIDRNTGAVTEIGPTGVGAIEAIAYYPIQGSETLYAANNGDFGTLNLSTGAFTEIAEIDGGGTASGSAGEQTLNDVDGLTLDGQTLIMWAVERQGGATPDLLFQIDLTTGQFIPDAFGAGVDYLEIVGPSIDVDVDDLAVDPITGEIYGVSNNGGSGDALIRVNKVTGEFTFVTSLAQDDIEGLAFHNDGKLYGSEGDGDNRLSLININTGAMSNFFTFTGSDVEGLAALVAPTNVVQGTVFQDDDLDGINDVGETGIANVTVYLYIDQDGDGQVDPEDTRVQTTTTDVNGDYRFDYITTGTLLTRTEFSSYPAGFSLTTDNIETMSFTDAINFGESDNNNDFGLGTGSDCDGDGLTDFFEGTGDADGDGILDQCDLDSDNDGIRDDVEGTEDFDDDGIPNYLDRDSDDDGIPDAIEANGGIRPAEYVDAQGNLSGAVGANGIVDTRETSAESGVMVAANPDSDGDTYFDYLDLDSDNDGIMDLIEAGATADVDSDGQVDGFVDANGNGYDDNLEASALAVPNTDVFYENSNGQTQRPNYIDIDSDADGIDDTREGLSTLDYRFPTLLGDNDQDGILDFWDISEGVNPITPVDTDMDGTPDYTDTNSDNDPESDFIEGNDADNNGVADETNTGLDANGNGLDDRFDSACSGVVCTSDVALPDTDTNGEFDFRDFEGAALDTDGDGVPDADDIDDDNDGILDVDESEVLDTDADGIPNSLDLDSDNDGIPDIIEAGGVDTDDDGRVDDDTDTDGDGWANTFDSDNGGTALANPDTDGDGLNNFLDLDSDGDGVVDLIESQATTGTPIIPTGSDSDSDGIDNAFDVTGGTPITPVDTESDGTPDYLDLDSDDDGFSDLLEAWDTDGDGIANVNPVGGDLDVDGLDNAFDNVTGPNNTNNVYNDEDALDFPDVTTSGLTSERDWREDNQVDSDGDGQINSIDIDDDDDGILDVDEGEGDFDNDGIINSLDLDSDNDGIPDIIEAGGVDTDDDGRVDDDTDTDNDGWADTFDPDDGGTILPEPDTDSDGRKNYVDIDSDGDGIVDLIESQVTSGTPTVPSGTDTDLDGLDNAFDTDNGGTAADPVDTETDGTPDYLDTDSDGDGFLDLLEGWDTDGDLTAETVPSGTDTDDDGLDDAFDNVVGPNSITNSPNNETAFNFPDVTTVGNSERDWRETNATDTDLDGIPDNIDIDDDNDGILDVDEGSGSSLDTDGDGIEDRIDLDSDNDGIPDIIEAGGVDANNDGRVDDDTDTDNDGWADTFDSDNGGIALFNLDSDNDGIKNFIDLDSDNDGIEDIIEAGGVDTDDDGVVDGYVDGDNDGWANTFDSDNGGTVHPLPDTDLDGLENYIDIDSDADGIVDLIESQATTGTPIIPLGTDTDGDGIDNAFDSDNGGTPITPVDTESDGTPDYIDFNSDNDSLSDAIEGHDTDGDGTVDTVPAGLDSDGDGLDDNFDDVIGPNSTNNVYNDQDANDFPDETTSGLTSERDWREANALDADGDGKLDAEDIDDDNDGILDVTEGTGDDDGDGIPNLLDLDSDNDGIPDIIEAGGVDTDNDGRVDDDTDTDDDGWADTFDSDDGGTALDEPDSDNDGVKNYIDKDSDNDGILDAVEANNTDADGDGQVDGFLDTDGDGYNDNIEGGVLVIPNTDSSYESSNGLPSLPNYIDIDSDADGIDDTREGYSTLAYLTPNSSLDTDGDGVLDFWDVDSGNNPIDPVDTDGAGLDDYVDENSDNDSLSDFIEGNDFDGNGVADVANSGQDANGNGLDDAFDGDCYGETVQSTATSYGEQQGTSVDIGSSDLELVTESANQEVGIYFPNITIPQGSTINSATIQFTTDAASGETNTGVVNLTIEGQLATNPAVFTTAANNVTGRTPFTSADEAWSPPDWGADGEAGADQRSVDISSIIEEIVAQGGWVNGNPIVIIITGPADGDSRTADNNPTITINYGSGITFCASNVAVQDSDLDGERDWRDSNGIDAPTDTDGDGVPDEDDIDDDNDGILDVDEESACSATPVVDVTSATTGSYTVLEDGEVTISINGGDGGGGSSTAGGSGATITSAVFSVSAGDVIRYVVGAGSSGSAGNSAGGAGSTGLFINNTLMMVAGGGGGGDNSGGAVGLGANATLAGDSGTGGSAGAGGVEGTGGGANNAGGGAGINEAGADGSANGGAAADLDPSDGVTLVAGGAGDGSSTAGGSGFTGGGGGADGSWSGGGGGYSGGGGAGDSGSAGGGGSFLNTADAAYVSGSITAGTDGGGGAAQSDGDDGFVTITFCAITDTDGDGLPDRIDIDADGDGIVDLIESQATTGTPIVPIGVDTDGDGLDDAFDADCAPCGVVTGIPTVLADTDSDGTFDFQDFNSDGDSFNDLLEGWDSDGNLVAEITPSGVDADNDGLDDAFDLVSGINSTTNVYNTQDAFDFPDVTTGGNIERDWREENAADTDLDGIIDTNDIDDDNDGVLDVDEGCVDTPQSVNGEITVDNDISVPNDDYPLISDGVIASNDGIRMNALNDLIVVDLGADIPSGVDVVFSLWKSNDDGKTLSFSQLSNSTAIPGGGTNIQTIDNTDITSVTSFAYTLDADTRYIQVEVTAYVGGRFEIVEATRQAYSVCSDDTDGDGINDSLDLDSDNDGIPDIIEAGGVDTDNDGRVDDDTDTDNDGWADTFDPDNGGTILPEPDTDNDGFDDRVDIDSDNDGIEDIIEAGGVDTDDDGVVDDATDLDGDGWANTFDSDNSGTALSNPDTDGDGLADNIDIDADADGIVDLIESQATTATPVIPVGTDDDSDGIDNEFDTTGGTPTTPVDTDGDGTPDYLDFNSDGDSYTDLIEGYDTDGDFTPDTTPSGTDSDGDGLDDNFDTVVGPNSTTNVYNNEDALDFPDFTTPGGTDQDWREENVIDTDADGVPDADDIDDDNDGILDVDEGLVECPTVEEIVGLTTDLIWNTDDGACAGNTNPFDFLVPGASCTLGYFGTQVNTGPIAGLEILNFEFSEALVITELKVLTDRTASFLENGATFRVEGSNDNISFTDITGTLPTSDGVATGNEEVFDLSSNSIAYTYYRILGIGGNYGWSPYVESVEFTSAVCNSASLDTDGDGTPDYLDLDSDNDGIPDIIEAGGVDTDNDGRVDDDTDGDGDGWANAFDSDNGGTALDDDDTDSDGFENRIDVDSDGDGIVDLIESQATTGTPVVPVGNDLDEDGIDDAFDVDCTPCGGTTGVPTVIVNTDGTDEPDYRDLDSDNDGLSDTIEAYDADGDYVTDDAPVGNDDDNDGLDDAFDLVAGPNETTNSTNTQTANTFPDITTAGATTERDWRESNAEACEPGGVDGNNFLLWLKADNGGTNWRDISNNYVSVSSIGPTSTGGNINYNPSNFFGGSNYFNTNLDVSEAAAANLSVIVVYQPTVDNAGAVWGESNGDFDRYILDADGVSENEAVSNGSGNTSNITGLYSVGNTTISAVIFEEDAAGGSTVYLNGANTLTNFTADHSQDAGSNTLQIGGLGDATERFRGVISEVIVYNSLLTSATDLQQIQSYLAIKYGVTLSSDNDGDAVAFEAGEGDYIASDGSTLFWDASDNTLTHNNVAGIVRDDASCLNQLQSKSESADAIVTIGLDADTDGLESSNAQNPSAFGADLSALMWGHDGESLYDNDENIDYDPFQVQSRLNREWRVRETGTVGTVTVSFDISNLLGPSGVGTNNEAEVVLLVDVDADGDFSTGAQVIDQTIITADDGIVNFEVDFTDGLYFTLASAEQYALPIELLSFEAEAKTDHVLIEWATLTETDNGFFRLERSSNGRDFSPFALIAGAGTTTIIQEYSHIDLNPYKGNNYYRLVDIALGGEESYSKIILVHYEDAYELAQPYPNPVRIGEYLNLRIPSGQKVDQVEFADVRGVKVRFNQSTKDGLLRIKGNDLKQGMYYLYVTISGKRHTFKVLVRN